MAFTANSDVHKAFGLADFGLAESRGAYDPDGGGPAMTTVSSNGDFGGAAPSLPMRKQHDRSNGRTAPRKRAWDVQKEHALRAAMQEESPPSPPPDFGDSFLDLFSHVPKDDEGNPDFFPGTAGIFDDALEKQLAYCRQALS